MFSDYAEVVVHDIKQNKMTSIGSIFNLNLEEVHLCCNLKRM